jgi:hypothetical protein
MLRTCWLPIVDRPFDWLFSILTTNKGRLLHGLWQETSVKPSGCELKAFNATVGIGTVSLETFHVIVTFASYVCLVM